MQLICLQQDLHERSQQWQPGELVAVDKDVREGGLQQAEQQWAECQVRVWMALSQGAKICSGRAGMHFEHIEGKYCEPSPHFCSAIKAENCYASGR